MSERHWKISGNERRQMLPDFVKGWLEAVGENAGARYGIDNQA